MKLHRIKRLSDGKFFVSGSGLFDGFLTMRSGRKFYAGPDFTRGGAFFKLERTIQNHLRNLCCNWSSTYDKGWAYERELLSGPHWERLDLYEVDILVVLDSETIKQPAKDFMGVLEDA